MKTSQSFTEENKMIKIDKEFESLIPPLSQEEFQQLEENCIRDGIRDPLVVWKVPNGDMILVDGHNRWKIAAKHGGMQFQIKEMRFDLRDDAKAWIIRNQLGRRNLPAYQRVMLVEQLKPMIAEKAKQQQIRKSVSQNSVEQKPIDTQKELAKIANVSHDTIHKVETIENSDNEFVKKQARNGEISINAAYAKIKKPPKPDPVKQALEEHEEFMQKQVQDVVNIADIQKDKSNKRLMYADLAKETIKLLNSLLDFGRNHDSTELSEMVKQNFTDDECRIFVNECQMCLRTITKLSVAFLKEG